LSYFVIFIQILYKTGHKKRDTTPYPRIYPPVSAYMR